MAASITPPGSVFDEPPLTPPPTAEKVLPTNARRVLKHLERLYRAHHQLNPWWEVRLGPQIYNQVLSALSVNKSLQAYVEEKIRYDYDIRRHRFIVRMPCPLHDVFSANVADGILQQIRQFQRHDSPTGEFARGLKHYATSRIFLPEETDDRKQVFTRREPDISFGHDGALYPGVILEVCYSQKSKSISYLADDYILNTDGSINMVIALDIDYRGSQKASFTVWRPDYLKANGVKELRAKAMIEAEVFRNDDRSPAEGVALQIPLRDFAPKELSQSYSDMDQVISISSRQLCDFLSSAESRQRVQTQQAGVVNRIDPGTLKRRRPRTPSEHPSSEDERQFNKRIRSNKRNSQSSDYRPGSSSGDSTTLKM
ncbi:hypothetical protein PENSOL_c047G09150 [Penicillium solitum]|uniref:Uncharacterized protein n=1 Tax=Penicillium solitum TaxID=60172 RepID=A0A1V6QSJ0_9EURO|nr:uncharacterized protein PENSOL_c047G09150 [Penicillium solitum]OQD91922.1 hypothetical protein PENSOL_c047G09150 [Penicillium solitum]